MGKGQNGAGTGRECSSNVFQPLDGEGRVDLLGGHALQPEGLHPVPRIGGERLAHRVLARSTLQDDAPGAGLVKCHEVTVASRLR